MFADSFSGGGDFNNWSTTATPLARDGTSNYWSVDVPGAAVGQAYKFFLPYAGKPGHNAYRMDPYARSIKADANNVMNAIVASSGTAYDGGSYSTPLWNEAVIYELHIATFNATAGSTGTFDTAMVRLPELAQLGVNAIEIMPLGQFSGSASTGYNPGYIFAVEDAFGGPDGFRTYVNAAHSLGIAVILDVVYNHVDGLDLWQFDGWSIEGRFCSWCAPQPPPVSVDGGIYFFPDNPAHTPYSHAPFAVGRPAAAHYLFHNVTGRLRGAGRAEKLLPPIWYDNNHDREDPGRGGGLPAIMGRGHANNCFAKRQPPPAPWVVLTAPAIPMLFMGQEFLEYRPFPNYGGYPDPIDWGRKDTYRGIWTLYRDMIWLRRNWYNNTRGLRGRNVHVLPVFGDNVLVYHRWDLGGPGDALVVVCNFANQRYANYQIGIPRSGIWRLRFNSGSHDYDGYFDNWPSFDTEANGPALNGMPYSANVSLGAYTCLVLSQD